MSHTSRSETELPSYEDIIGNKRPLQCIDENAEPRPLRGQGQRLLDQLTTVRAQRVRSIVDEHVMDVVERQALRGVGKVTVALIPSDTAGLQESEYCDSHIGPCSLLGHAMFKHGYSSCWTTTIDWSLAARQPMVSSVACAIWSYRQSNTSNVSTRGYG